MVAAVIVVADEVADLGFEVSRQIVVLQKDAVLGRLMPALDLALRLRVIGRTTHMLDAPIIQPLGQLTRDV